MRNLNWLGVYRKWLAGWMGEDYIVKKKQTGKLQTACAAVHALYNVNTIIQAFNMSVHFKINLCACQFVGFLKILRHCVVLADMKLQGKEQTVS